MSFNIEYLRTMYPEMFPESPTLVWIRLIIVLSLFLIVPYLYVKFFELRFKNFFGKMWRIIMRIKKGAGVIFLLFGIILMIRDWLVNFSKWEFIDVGIGFPINVFLLNIFLGFLFMLIGLLLILSYEKLSYNSRISQSPNSATIHASLNNKSKEELR